jgi:hypothetical protein
MATGIGRFAADPIARPVKRAGIADNLQPWRTARLDPETWERLVDKYATALLTLDLAEAGVVGR